MGISHRIWKLAARTWVFFVPYLLWVVLAGLLVALTDKADLHLTLNSLNALGGDRFYTLVTYLGDRRLAWVVGFLLCFRGIRRGAAVLLASIGAGLSTEFLKYVVVASSPRPVAYFGDPSPLYLVPGFENKLDYSMPSGHAAIALALLASIAIQSRSRLLQLSLVALALCAAYSRVHLSEHFMADIVAGSLLGVAWALLAYALLRPLAPKKEDTPEVRAQD